jgi:hypothetical protein
MNFFKLIVELFVVYLLFKLVFDFIIPVYRTTRQMKQKMNEMHRHMEQNQDAAQKKPDHASTPGQKKDFSKDYIEYEEIK